MSVEIFKEIKGHPVAELEGMVDQRQVLITLCAGCGQMRTILFLDRDRWFCTSCRNEGKVAPTVIPISMPRKGRRHG